MSNDFQQGNPINPYQSTPPNQFGSPPMNATKVQAPAIGLIIVGVLGLLASLWGTVNAMVSTPPPLPPDAPEFMRQITENSVGPVAAGINAIFILVTLVIVIGGIQMLRFKSWGLALTASILAMINFVSCCCILGLPIGIWSLIILLMADVKQHFARNAG